MSYEVKVEDVEYLRHGTTPYLATIYRPQGPGPFPIMVELHGGAWCRSDRHGDKVIHEALAKTGVIVATLDWRQPPTASYPASFQDIHYGIRWIKSRAVELGGRPDMVGSMGNSSGGHQAMLLAMRPFDPRYSALPLAAAPNLDATVRCVIMTSPVMYVSPERTSEECMALMTENRFRHLPVMDKGKLVGLVSIGDLVKDVISEQKFIIEQLEHYIAG